MKKLLSLVLVLSLVLGSVGFAFAAPAADVAGTVYEGAATRLNALDIMKGYPDGSFMPGNNITRAEYAALVIRALGDEDSAMLLAGSDTGFSDVPADHWAAGYILLASQKGIINGYGNGMFGPNDNIKYVDALVMAVRALGYSPKADDKGGYPSGYIAVANDLGLTDDITVAALATRGMVAQILDNALTVPFMVQKTFGDEETYVVSGTDGTDEETFLTALDVAKVEGTVIMTPLYGDNDEMEITLDSTYSTSDDAMTYEVLDVAGVDVDSLMAKEVTAWMNDDDEILLVEVDSVVYTFNAIEANEDTSADALVIDGDEYEFADEAIGVWNTVEGLEFYGDLYDFHTMVEQDYDLLDGMKGEVILDEDGEEIMAVLFWAFSSEYAERIDEVEVNKMRILPVDGVVTDLDNDTNEVGFVYIDDVKADIEDLEEDMVYYVIEDGNVTLVMAYTATVEGKVTKVTADGTDLYVDGVKYDVEAVFYIDDNESGYEDTADLLGDEVTILLDYQGDVVYVDIDDEDSGTDLYAIVMDTYADTDTEFDTTYIFKVKLMLPDGDDVIYDVVIDEEDSATVDNTWADGTTDFEAWTSIQAWVTEDMLVLYELDADGDIDVFEIVEDDVVTADYDMYEYDEPKAAFTTGSSFLDIADDVVIFNIEADGDYDGIALGELVDEKDYTVLDADYNSADEITVMVLMDGDFTADADYAYFVDYALVDGGYEIELFMGGEEVTYFADEDDVTLSGSYDEGWVEVEFTGGDIESIDFTPDNFTTEGAFYIESATSSRIKVWTEYSGGLLAGDFSYYYYADDCVVIFDNNDDDVEIYEIADLGKYQAVDLLFNSDDELVGIVVTNLDITD